MYDYLSNNYCDVLHDQGQNYIFLKLNPKADFARRPIYSENSLLFKNHNRI